MRRVIDYIVLLILCMLTGLSIDNTEKVVVYIFVLLIVFCFNEYFRTEKITFIIFLCYLVLCAAVPFYCLGLPVVLYAVMDSQRKFPIAVLITGFLLFGKNLHEYKLYVTIIWGIFAAIFHVRTKEFEELSLEYKAQRDASKELTILLEERNQQLLEHQEYEVRAAKLGERNRIAREIHDNVGHMLSRGILQMAALGTINKQDSLKPFIEEIKETLCAAMDSIRNSVHNLHDESVTMGDAVENMLKPFSSYHIEWKMDYSIEPDKKIKYCLLSIMKEALSNISKHSNADKINIIVKEHPAFYQMLIEDNGTKKPNLDAEGMGLGNMRDRVSALHGNIHFSYKKGFKIFLTIPKEQKKSYENRNRR